MYAQSQLELMVSKNSTVDHQIDFSVSPFQMEKILEITGKKMEIRSQDILFDGQSLQVKSCKTRGNTTLLFRRKSFSISLDQPFQMNQVPVKRMAVNNLAMDKNYWRGRLSFIFMREIGIFPLENHYVETRINGETQGIYLVVQKPEDYSRSIGSNLLLRKEEGKRISIEFQEGINGKTYTKQLKNIHLLSDHLSGEMLKDSIQSILDLEKYYQWLSFNYLIMNGDYTDELFFFLNPDNNILGIIPWDYDDIFMAGPHEGLQKRNEALGEKLIFSSESNLDMTIANDPYLYAAYLRVFNELLSTFTTSFIKRAFEQVYRELIAYYLDPLIISQSTYDQYGTTDLETLQSDLNKHYHFLLRRRDTIYETLMLKH